MKIRQDAAEDMALIQRILQTFIEEKPASWFKDAAERQRAIDLSGVAGYYAEDPQRLPGNF